MRVFDAHCDVLWKLATHADWSFAGERGNLDVTPGRLAEGNVRMQTFALYADEPRFGPLVLLEETDRFYEDVLCAANFVPVRTRSELERAEQSPAAVGAMLTLEGVDALWGNLALLRLLFRLGVRSVGLTWNNANWAADGVAELRGGGLTAAGRRLLEECRAWSVAIDVSHLGENAFHETIDWAEANGHPVFASHANARSVCGHPRNLSDEQLIRLFSLGGVVGLTFVPAFLKNDGNASIDDVLRHLEHVCELGGRRHVGFGSDFDGTPGYVRGLEHPGKFAVLADVLLRYYSDDDVQHFLYGNWRSFWHRNLPD